jgi:D-sedoheptulose 7-phosphate isomerase
MVLNKIIQNKVTESINVKKKIIENNIPDIINASKICIKGLKKGGKLIFCGNGGSASDSQHLATEMLVRLNPNINRKPISAISLNLDSVSMSAHSNDYDYNSYLSRMLSGLGKKDDILIVISTSGNSKNILNVLKQARKMKITCISFLGNKGGKAKKFCKNNIIVESNNTARIQEAHICIGHILMDIIEEKICRK